MSDTTTPLAELEEAVRLAAERQSLLLDRPGSAAGIRALVDHELGAWADQHRQGHRPAIADPDRLAERALRNLVGYGPLTPLLEDDDVWEVMVNSPDRIFAKRHRGRDGYHHEVFHDDDHVLRTLTRILDDAPGSARRLDPSLGLQDAQLASGARLHIVHRELGRGGHTLVNIRKFSGVAYEQLDDLTATGMLDRRAVDLLSAAVAARCSVIVAGPPGAGKTTLLSCLLSGLDPSLRVVTAEEVFEADIPVANVAGMQTRSARADCGPIDLRRLVGAFLRMAPDVAAVGEVRDREALPYLLTLSSGVTGYTTIHAGSARQALGRLRFLCQLDGDRGVSHTGAIGQLVAETVDLVVVCRRGGDGPRVVEVSAVEDPVAGGDLVQFALTPLARRPELNGPLEWSDTPSTRLETRGVDLDPGAPGARVEMIRLLLSVLAGTGVSLVVLDRLQPSRSGTGTWRARAGQAAKATGFAVAVAAASWLLVGAPIVAAVAAGGAVLIPRALASRERRRRADRLVDAWPRMLDEARVLCGPGGLSLPQSLFTAGRAASEDLRRGWAAAERTWRLSVDLPRSLRVVEHELHDATTDLVCSTLAVIHGAGGPSQNEQLARLAADRRRDAAARRTAESELAGARFARRFVLIVPLGMALAGQSVGTGRAAFQSPAGQLAALVAVFVTGACWIWSGRLLSLPVPSGSRS